MSMKNMARSLYKTLAAVPARVARFFSPVKAGGQGRISPRMLVVFYLLIITAIIGAYSLRGPLGEILIRADPLPFTLEEEEAGDEEGEPSQVKDHPITDVLAAGRDPLDGQEESSEDVDSPAFSPSTPLLWPVEGDVLVRHGEMFRVGNQYRSHTGIDIEAVEGTEVKAAWHGTVKETGHSLLLGQYVLISHGGQYLTYYANLGSIEVREGASVRAKDVLGRTGSSAVVDAGPGNHLHFALYRVEGEGEEARDVALDPMKYLLRE